MSDRLFTELGDRLVDFKIISENLAAAREKSDTHPKEAWSMVGYAEARLRQAWFELQLINDRLAYEESSPGG